MMVMMMVLMKPLSTASEYSKLFYQLPVESKHGKLYNMDFPGQFRKYASYSPSLSHP